MGLLPGALRKARKSHVPAFAKGSSPQDREGNFLAHPTGVVTQEQAEVLDWEGVVIWGPDGQDLALPRGSAAAAATSHANF